MCGPLRVCVSGVSQVQESLAARLRRKERREKEELCAFGKQTQDD